VRILNVKTMEFPVMATLKNIKFIENPALNGSADRYMTVSLDTAKVLKSWKRSLFSFEWLRKDGTIKTIAELSADERAKRAATEKKLETDAPIEQPVFGIGIADNVEIGMGRAEFLTLAALGHKTITVHIPKSCESDFKLFRADIK
jgi:hypothetical protein